MACACSVFSFAMTVRLLISYLLLLCRSFKDSSKSAATSADEPPEIEPLGDREDILTSRKGREAHSDAEVCYLVAADEMVSSLGKTADDSSQKGLCLHVQFQQQRYSQRGAQCDQREDSFGLW